ncbi:unnamed protein product, partial [Schistosoma haematobium]
MDPKLTEGDEEEKSMSMNGDLNSLVSSRSISFPDRGGTVEPVGAVVPMMVGRQRGRRGTVRGNVGSGESFSPLRLSESVLAEPIVEKGSVNGDASTVSGCSVLTVGESKAVCVLTAMDPKLTEGDEEEKSMSMNGDLNSLVSSRSISFPDRGGTVEPVGAVVPMMVGRQRGRRGTVRGNVGSGESFSPLRLSESVLAEPIVEKGSVNGDASTVSGCSVLTVGESKAVCVLTAMDPKLTEGDEEEKSMSMNGDLNSLVSSRSISSPDRGGTVEPVGAVVPMMVGRRRGRRGTVRGNVGSGESFSPLRLSESVLAEPIVEKGSVNGDASTVSGCSVLTVGESKAVCVLTAMDPKLTEGDEEEKSMSMNGDLNSLVSSRSISSPDRGGTVEPVGAVVPMMVGRRRGRRGTVRGNVGSGESFSPLRLSESVLAEPIVEKGSVNGDASTVSGCSVLTVGESKAVCVLTAMDPKLTEGDEEEKSMSMNGDLNSLVSSRSISFPDRGGTVEPVGAVVPMMVGRRRGRRGTVRGNVGSGESFSPLRLSESVLAEPIVEKGSVNGDASTVSGCSVLTVGESKAVCVLTAMDPKLTEGDEEEKSMSMNGDLNSLVSSRSISFPDRGGTVEPVGAVVPMMVGRQRGRRGTVRGNVGSGESFSPLRLSESVLAEPIVEKGSVNGDASTVSGCSVLTVGESKAVCVLTAMDPKLTEGDEEEKSMSMNGDLNSLVSSRSISFPDRGGTVEPVGAVVPMMVGRRRGRRGTVRGNVGSGESFSPLRLSESVLAEPIVEKGSVNGDASTVSGCSVLTVGESKAVCVLTAMDPKLTEGDEEEKSMSMNGDLNSLVSSRSISFPDRGGTVEPVGAVVPMMVGRRRGRRGTVRGNVGSGESFSPLRLSESVLAEPIVEKGSVNGDASTVSGCSVLTVGESKAVCVLTAMDPKLTEGDEEEKSMSMNGDLNSLVSSRSISSPDRGGTVEPVGAVVPMMVGRRRGRRGTVRGNVGSGESFSPLRLSESVLAEPIVEKGSVNGDASTVSGCSVLTVGESKAVCVLTAMDPKLTEGDEEEKSMSMNGDLNSLVSSRSISSPDRGGTVEPVGAVVPMMVGRRRGRRGTVRGNVGSGESFSPLRLSESVLAEPIVEKGSVNGDASTVSGCSVLTVGESKAVCVLTAMDPKLTEGDEEEKSMSMNGDLNSLVSSRSISSPDRGGTVEPVGAVVPMMVGRRRGRRGTVRGNVGSGESFSPLRLSESVLAEPIVEKGSVNGDASTVSGCSVLTVGESKAVCVLTAMDPKLIDCGPSFSENKTVNFNLPSLPINVTALSSTFPQSISAVQQLCSVKGTTSKKRRLLGEQDRISALMSLNEFEDDYKSEAHRISSKTRLSQLTYSRASSDSKLYPETVDSVLPLIKPVSIVITDCFLESEEDDIVDSGQLVKKRRKNSVVLDEEKNVSRDNSEMLKLPVSSLQALSPIPYRCEDDVAIPD